MNFHNILKIVLAAGNSKRFGSKNKLLQKLAGKKVLEHTIENLLQIFDSKEILVITGFENQKIESCLKKYKVFCSFNKNYDQGIGCSIAHALKNYESLLALDGVMIIPGDMPLISTNDYKKIVNAFKQINKNKIVCPLHKNIEGNPLILPKSIFGLLKNLKKDQGAKSYLLKKDIFYVNTGYGTIFDIDSLKDLQKAKSLIS